MVNNGGQDTLKIRQEKTFIIIILPVQFLGTQLAKNGSRGVPN